VCAAEKIADDLLHGCEGGILHLCPAHKHYVEARAKFHAIGANGFPQPALEAVARNRAAQLFADGKSDATRASARRTDIDYEQWMNV
jgi:hypothetical protein